MTFKQSTRKLALGSKSVSDCTTVTVCQAACTTVLHRLATTAAVGLLCQATGIGCWIHRSDCSASMCVHLSSHQHANATACCCCWHYTLKPYCPYSKWLLLWSTSRIQAMCTLSRTLGAKMRKQSRSAPDADACLLLSHTHPQHTQSGKRYEDNAAVVA